MIKTHILDIDLVFLTWQATLLVTANSTDKIYAVLEVVLVLNLLFDEHVDTFITLLESRRVAPFLLFSRTLLSERRVFFIFSILGGFFDQRYSSVVI
jgi:hypothetical protein